MRAFLHRVRNHHHIQSRPGLKQFIKFGMVGVSNTALDFSVFYIMFKVFDLHYLPANVVAFCVATTWSFIMNRRWTFQNFLGRRHVQYAKFFTVSCIGLGLTSLLLITFVDGLHLPPLLAKILAVFIVLFWNFTANRKWTFR